MKHGPHDLDDALARSAPPLEESTDLDEALAALVLASRPPRQVRRRHGRRGVLIGTSTAALVAVGTAAAAAITIGGWTAPWADDPDGAISFSLPSGPACELRIGALSSSRSEDAREVRAWLDDHTLEQIADVPKAVEAIRSDPPVWVRDDGTEVLTGYGTAYYDADAEYVDAVYRAVTDAISHKTRQLGTTEGGWFGSEGELRCGGGDPDPGTPWYLR